MDNNLNSSNCDSTNFRKRISTAIGKNLEGMMALCWTTPSNIALEGQSCDITLVQWRHDGSIIFWKGYIISNQKGGYMIMLETSYPLPGGATEHSSVTIST